VARARACVCLFQLPEHVGDVAGMLESCVAALQPGGGLIVSVPNEDGFMGVEKLPPLHPLRASVPWRGMAALIGAATEAAHRREPRLRPRGHSIAGVFGKS
jgi:2-polyprenyl-3-methyl-5-hydroxy-6-metoxy-1,4-benzoquinol methylase